MIRRWGVLVEDGSVVEDKDWSCAAHVMRSGHGFGHGPLRVVVNDGDGWKDFWEGNDVQAQEATGH